MPKSLETGQKAEEEAVGYLKGLGYDIIQKNWRFKHLEIDIIARDGEFLVFVEVKARKNADFGAPEVFVTRPKQKKLIRAAHFYYLENPCDLESRFDIIAVNNQSGAITHIKRAFYPDLR